MKVKIKYQKVYSDTMENDKHNRWQRIAIYAGYKIAFITKMESEGIKTGFRVDYRFPIIRCSFPVIEVEYTHTFLHQAKAEIERTFNTYLTLTFEELK